MGILQSAFDRMWLAGFALTHGGGIRAANQITDPADLYRVLIEGYGGGPTRSGVTVTADRAMQQATVHTCVRILSESVAHLPLNVHRRTGSAGDPKGGTMLDRASPIYSLLHDRPNEWQTAMEWRELKEKDLLIRGNAYSLIVRDARGGVDELIRLHPDNVTPKQADDLSVTYEYRRPKGSRVTLSRSEVFHIRGMGDDGLQGKGVVQYHRETVADALATQEHGSRFFSNGARPLGILEAPPGVKFDSKSESMQNLKADFESLYMGVENAHRTAILPDGFKYTPVSMSNEDAQFLETRKFNRTEIAAIYRVPPHMVGDLDRATFSNIEQQALEFVRYALMPWCVRWEQAIHRDLLDSDPERFAKHNVNALERGDFKSRQEGLAIQKRNGIISPNEWRRLEDMNPRDDDAGDLYTIEKNMQTDDGLDNTEPFNNPERTVAS